MQTKQQVGVENESLNLYVLSMNFIDRECDVGFSANIILTLFVEQLRGSLRIQEQSVDLIDVLPN